MEPACRARSRAPGGRARGFLGGTAGVDGERGELVVGGWSEESGPNEGQSCPLPGNAPDGHAGVGAHNAAGVDASSGRECARGRCVEASSSIRHVAQRESRHLAL